MRIIFALVLIVLTSGISSAERQWVNDIAVNEYNMTWNYEETFTGADAIEYRMSIDRNLGDNDSLINAWELLKADKEARRSIRSSIEREMDVRVNNETKGIEIVDIDSALSSDLIGKTHMFDSVVNRYSVTYRFNESILNAGSIWFLGQANSTVTIVLPSGVDVVNISEMDNVTRNSGEIKGVFKGISKDRGEITLNLAKNTSIQMPEINVTSTPVQENVTPPMNSVLSKIRDASVVGVGVIIIILIYIFKLRKK